MVAAHERVKREQVRDMFMAWQTAAFVGAANVGKLPEWQQVMLRMGPRSSQSLRLEAELILGMPMRPISKEAMDALLKLRES